MHDPSVLHFVPTVGLLWCSGHTYSKEVGGVPGVAPLIVGIRMVTIRVWTWSRKSPAVDVQD